VVIALGASALLLAGVILLIPFGLRAGDQLDDALVLDVEPLARSRGAVATVTNPGDAPVLLGLSLRRAGLRQRLDGPAYVRIRSGRTSTDLLAGTQACIGVVEAGETATFALAADPGVRRRAELVAVIGQPRRLRTVHRLVLLTQEAGCNEATIAGNRPTGMLSVRVFDTQ
jgi:hypothetical protein